MAECRWVAPVLVAQFEFVEWTQDGHLRHASPAKVDAPSEKGDFAPPLLYRPESTPY